MGVYGASVVPDAARVLTHCNAGALATAGYGTALGVIRGAVEQGKTRRGARRRDAAVPPGRAADGVGADSRRHRHDGHHRQHVGCADARRARSTSSSSAPIGSPQTATSRTRSAPTPWPCSRRRTAFRSTSRRRYRRSILATADGSLIPIEERNAKEVTHLGPATDRARGRARCATRRSTSRRTSTSPPSSPRRGIARRAILRVAARSRARSMRGQTPHDLNWSGLTPLRC